MKKSRLFIIWKTCHYLEGLRCAGFPLASAALRRFLLQNLPLYRSRSVFVFILIFLRLAHKWTQLDTSGYNWTQPSMQKRKLASSVNIYEEYGPSYFEADGIRVLFTPSRKASQPGRALSDLSSDSTLPTNPSTKTGLVAGVVLL